MIRLFICFFNIYWTGYSSVPWLQFHYLCWAIWITLPWYYRVLKRLVSINKSFKKRILLNVKWSSFLFNRYVHITWMDSFYHFIEEVYHFLTGCPSWHQWHLWGSNHQPLNWKAEVYFTIFLVSFFYPF